MNATENTACEVTGSVLIKNAPQEEKRIVVSGIYGLRNKINNKWYIGQSRDIFVRWKDYEKLYCKNQKKILHALKKYGFENFDKVIIEEISSEEWVLDYREMYWIREYNSISNGYNIAEGGGVGISFKGRKHSDETKRKMSAWQIGRKRPPETIERMRKSLTGKKYGPKSEEVKEKIRLGNIGKVLSEETRKKISSSRQNVSMETRMKLSASNKGKQAGEKNPCFGKKWITDGNINRFVKGTDVVPDGWRYGKIWKPRKLDGLMYK